MARERASVNSIQHVFIIGCKGIPANYGGFETFVEKLTENQASNRIKYHVACAVDEIPEKHEFEHNGAHCFRIQWRPIGAARAIFYDLDALSWAIDYAKKNRIKKPIFYILACRIGPFIGRYAKKIHGLDGNLYVKSVGRTQWFSLMDTVQDWDRGRDVYHFVKRAFDIACSAVVIVVGFVPAMLLGLAICIETPGNPFYGQARVGKVDADGEPSYFRMWQLDLGYVAQRGIKTDLALIAQTVRVVVTGGGAF